ncbi:MAG: response regulator transcription factor [Bacteroidales bacterium]|nr:response regulator transcription factor [Bacteroidales bacterium]
MDKKKILIAEDEANISDFISRGLKDLGYYVEVFGDGSTAWQQLENNNTYDLLLLDIRMPGMSGLEVCQRFRGKYGYHTPVLMLTALGTTDDIVMGLHVGADDYLVKPFKFMELIARIQALLRRAGSINDNTLCYGDLTIFAASHKAKRGNIEVELSTKEYRLLEYLITHHDQIITRKQLLKDVWDKDFDTNTNIVDVYVRYVRTKIDEPFEQKLIHTIVGIGYCMKKIDANDESR